MAEKPQNKKRKKETNNIKIKSSSGYNAIREKLDENNTLTAKQQPIESVKPKTKMITGV